MKKTLLPMMLVILLSIAASSAYAIPVTFKNDSFNTIDLFVPGFKNSTMKPKTSYGVDLAKGQKVFFTYEGRQYLLFTVSDDMKDKSIKICELIQQRIEQIEGA